MESCFAEYIGGIHIARLLVCAFMAILFLQSGLDKVFNYRDNLNWLKGHFSNSPLSEIVPLMVITITIVEVAAGTVSLIGGVLLYINGITYIAILGISLAGLALVMLFFGQRMAKDYAGAASLVGYFILAILGLLLFN